MRSTGKYDSSDDDYDVDHEISKYVDKTHMLINGIFSAGKNDADARLILEAVRDTIEEAIINTGQ